MQLEELSPIHVALDDSHGSTAAGASRYMTGRRRNWVAVNFPERRSTRLFWRSFEIFLPTPYPCNPSPKA